MIQCSHYHMYTRSRYQITSTYYVAKTKPMYLFEKIIFLICLNFGCWLLLQTSCAPLTSYTLGFDKDQMKIGRSSEDQMKV